GLGKSEIAVNLAHHVDQELVRRIAAMHGAADFGCRERTKIAALVVELAIIPFQPMFELKTGETGIDLIGDAIGDRTDAEERIGGALRRAGPRGFDRRPALSLEFRCKVHSVPPSKRMTRAARHAERLGSSPGKLPAAIARRHDPITY